MDAGWFALLQGSARIIHVVPRFKRKGVGLEKAVSLLSLESATWSKLGFLVKVEGETEHFTVGTSTKSTPHSCHLKTAVTSSPWPE